MGPSDGGAVEVDDGVVVAVGSAGTDARRKAIGNQQITKKSKMMKQLLKLQFPIPCGFYLFWEFVKDARRNFTPG